jgi:hypothetical protein
MQRLKPRTALAAAAVVAAAAAITAGPALAAVTVTTATQPATPVTATTADLNGIVDPDGVEVSYVFKYWLASKPSAATLTPMISIGTGIKTEIPILVEITDLKPGANYKFELLTSTGTPGSAYYPLESGTGGVLGFKTTSAGKLTLTSTKLKVKKSRVSIALKCASTLTCTGKVAITAKGKVGTKTKTYACGSTKFTIAAGDKDKVTTSKISSKCATLLSSATNKKIKAKLTATLTTYQPTLSKTVSLTS